MRIGLAQTNSWLGDFAGNRAKIVEFTRRAFEKRCDLVLFPELTLMGYMPNDLLERKTIVAAQLREFEKLKKEIPKGIGVIVGLVTPTGRKKGKPYFNTAALLERGKKPKFFHKELLPTYDVFDEARHMSSGRIADGFFTYKNKKCLLTICEDIWGWELPKHPTNYLENPLVKLKGKKVDFVLNISASPFTMGKAGERRKIVAQTARNFKAPVVYVNMVGAQDEIIFDGGSFAVDARGRVLAQSIHFEEDLNVIDFGLGRGGTRAESPEPVEHLRRALVLGIRDFAHKSGFSRAHLGLSGGIDSAVVACLAVDAFGPGRVTGLAMPGPYSADVSLSLAENLARSLGIECSHIPIDSTYSTMLESLNTAWGKLEFGVMHENLQSRLRGMVAMAFANKNGSMLLTTGNKSELATGYATLYGDMCGGLAPIGDLLKGEVYRLARHYNSERELIPAQIISREPSAELRPNQKDQDTLPPYDELDECVRRLVEHGGPAKSPRDRWLVEVLARTEFKRWQAPPVLKVSGHAFGRGRRMPLARRALV